MSSAFPATEVLVVADCWQTEPDAEAVIHRAIEAAAEIADADVGESELAGMLTDDTGIRTLKVSYNKVFGYYIEISRGQSDNAPEHYIRKQTLVNAERYITPELKEYETLVLNADDRILEIESRLFKEMCAEVGQQAARLLATY